MSFKVSLILPTFNNQRTIRQCLEGIFRQDYPKKYFEVLVIDGGSTDSTLEICKKYPLKILKNKWRVEEKGRVIGINSAKNEIVGFIDADNIIYDNNFLEKMVEPFDDEEIIGTDTLYFDYKKNDSLLTRYCALLSGDDPYSIYLGLRNSVRIHLSPIFLNHQTQIVDLSQVYNSLWVYHPPNFELERSRYHQI